MPWTLVNGLLNTFAIHSRNLIDFLYSRREGKDYPTDIIIDDFVDGEVIENHLAPISESLKEARVKANKQATHLTVDRIEYEKAGKEWKFIAIAEEIKRAFSSIAPHISNSRVSETLRMKLSEPRLSIPLMHVSTVLGKGGAKVGISLSLQAP